MTHKSTVIVLLLAAVLLLILSGCASSGGANVGYLLEQDYARMNNAQLTAYEQELSDEIAASAASEGSSSGISLGLGVGSWGSHGGVGLGVGKRLGGGGDDPRVELLDRREAVREEMRRRGLLPATDK